MDAIDKYKGKKIIVVNFLKIKLAKMIWLFLVP
jgi:hypothetical protein